MSKNTPTGEVPRASLPSAADSSTTFIDSPEKERGLPITWLLPLLLAALVLCAVVPVIVLGFYGARDNTSRLLRDRDELVLDVVVERIAAHLDPVRVQVAFVVDAVRLGKLDVEDEAALRTALVSALAATPQTTGIAFVRSDLRVTRYNRLDYRIYDDVDVARIPNGRSHLDAARSGAEPSWIGPVWSDPLDQRILQFRAPLVGAGGEFRGVLVAAVSIMDLSRYLGEIEDDLGQTPFVLTGQEQVVAHPLLASTAVSSRFGSAQPLPHISVFPDRYLASIWARPLNALNASVPFRRSRGHWNWVPGGGYEAHTYLYRAMTGYGEMPWLVGFHYPGIETRRARWIVAGIGVGGTALLVLAIFAAIIVGRRLGKPVLELAEAASRVEAFEFDRVKDLPRGPVREINVATAAVERMARGLTWFQIYVPRMLVRRLMASGDGSPPSDNRDVTVMFTDLERYTEYSEDRSASEVVTYLNALLARIGPIIEDGGGTIDKFIGDSVMAFWGAPEDDPGHARAACRAAGRIAREVASFNFERRKAGHHACRMRIGLHTGPVSVGNIGFAGRVDYTIVGRTVNIAQRLEQAAREVSGNGEVLILVSNETASRAGHEFRFTACTNVCLPGVGSVQRLHYAQG